MRKSIYTASPSHPSRFTHIYHRSIGQVAPGNSGRSPWIERGIYLGVFAAGATLGLLTYPHRAKPVGALAFGAAASVVGVAITFLVIDLLD